MLRPPASSLAILAIALAPVRALAEPLPLRVDYEAAAGCPGADVFLDEIRWRTSLARVASAGEEALAVHARVARRGGTHVGTLSLGRGKDRVTREVRSERCDEVVSALALVTALAVDPRASTAPRPPSIPPPPPPPPAPPPPPPPPPPREPPPPQILADPLPVLPAVPSPPAPRPWTIAARASMAFGVTPGPLFGGGLVAERAFTTRFGPSLRLSIDAGGTGAVATDRGSAWFVRGIGRVEGCLFTARPAAWISIVPCVAAEGGVLHGQGIASANLTRPESATVPWAGAGVLPRVAIEIGPVVLDAQGGPVFSLVRREFVFDPDYVVHDVPPVTAMIALGAGARFR